MNVSHAKIAFEHKTLAYALEKICSQLNVSKCEIDAIAKQRISQHPPLQLGKASSSANIYQRHGYWFEVGKVLYESVFPYTKSVAPVSSCDNQLNAPELEAAVESIIVDVNPPESSRGAEAESLTESIQHGTAEPTQSETDVEPRATLEINTLSVTEFLKSDVCTFFYMTAIHGLYHEMLLNRDEQINRENCEDYIKFARYILESYFGVWRSAHLMIKDMPYQEKIKLCLDNITWRNLRLGVVPFFYMARYVLNELKDQVPNLHYIPMLYGNQSDLESQLSSTRASNHDRATNYASYVTTKSGKQALAALASNKMYSSDDIVSQKEGSSLVGISVAK
jgi:hypothetical protein